MNDIFGLGKVLPLDKLIDVLSQVTGKITKPYFDRVDIRTEAYKIKELAKARAEEVKIMSKALNESYQITGGIEYKDNNVNISSPKDKLQDSASLLGNASLEERTQDRVSLQEAKKQLNIESATAYAYEALKDEPPVTDEPVDEDWIGRYINIVGDVSSDEMQALWGKILAGEIKRPKSFSLRTLEFLKNLSKEEAECFMKIGQMAITMQDGTVFLLSLSRYDSLELKFRPTVDEELLIEELGVISNVDGCNISFDDSEGVSRFRVGNIVLLADNEDEVQKSSIGVTPFTTIGKELLQLIERNPPYEYIQLFLSKLRNAGLKISYSENLQSLTGEVNLADFTMFPLTEEEEQKRTAI